MPIAPILIQGGLQVAGALLNRRKKISPPDVSPLIRSLNESGVKQQGLIKGVRPQTTALGQDFQTKTSGLAQSFQDAINQRGQTFVNEAGDSSGALAEASANAGKRQILSALPEQAQNTREALASSGLARGGALVSALAKQNQEAGKAIGNLNEGIQLQTLQGKQQALQDVFRTDTAAAERATGMNADVLNKLFSSGREDLINEALQLIDEERSRTGNVVNLKNQQLNNDFAGKVAGQQNKTDLINSLIGAGSGVVGGLAQNKQQQDLLKSLGLVK